MDNHYIKDFPRGNSREIEATDKMFPVSTGNLNILYSTMSGIRRLKDMVSPANSDIEKQLSDIEAQGRFNIFINLCFLDFFVIYKNTLTAIHLWEDVSALRQGYLLIYEVIKTYHSHSKAIHELCSKTSEAAEEKFAQLAINIKYFKKDFQYDKEISEIRNYTIGHIENDPVKFFERISSFDNEKAFRALKYFGTVLYQMQQLSEYIYEHYTRKVIRDSSFGLADMQEYAVEIEKLLNELDSQGLTDG
jgi:hypothetical protein